MQLHIVLVKRVGLRGISSKWSVILKTFDEAKANDRLAILKELRADGEPRLLSFDLPIDLPIDLSNGA